MMMLNDFVLVLLYLCVLIVKSCDVSASFCRTFGFGDSAEGAAPRLCKRAFL